MGILLFLILLNFFFTSRDSKKCARWHGDKHLHKMIVEHAQILSNVWHLIGDPTKVPDGIYKSGKSHAKHPIVVWACKSLAHYDKILDVSFHLADERRRRKFSPKHKTEDVLKILQKHKPAISNFELGDTWTDPPACVPDEYLVDAHGTPISVVTSYRLCIAGDKYHIINLRWEPRTRNPPWLQKYQYYISERRPDIRDGISKRRQERDRLKNKKQDQKKVKRALAKMELVGVDDQKRCLKRPKFI